MQPDEATPTEAEPQAEPAAETVEDENLITVTPETGADEEELDFRSAFVEAKAELEGTAEPQDSGSDEQQPPASSDTTPNESSPPESSTPVGDQGSEWRTFREKVRAGDVATLTAEQRDVLQAARELRDQELAEERKFRSYYLELRKEQVEDPDAYIQRIDKDPRIAAFVKSYADAHPDVTLDTPEGAGVVAPDAARIRADLDREYSEAVIETARQMSAAAGLGETDFNALRNEYQAPGRVLQAAWERSIDRRVEAERARIRTEERTAAMAEAAAKYGSRTAVTPRQIPGVPPKTAVQTPTGPTDSVDDWRAALQEARLEIAKR